MAENDGSTLRAIAWWDICPWLILVRCVRLAIGLRLMLLAALAALGTLSGWALLGRAFSADPQVAAQIAHRNGCSWLALADLVPDQPRLPGREDFFHDRLFTSVMRRSTGAVIGTWEELSRPFRKLFDFGLLGSPPLTRTTFAFNLLCGLWALAVWSLFAGAITRVAAVQLAAEERIGWTEMMRFAVRRWRSYFAAPLWPLVGVMFGVAVLALTGWLLRSTAGVLLAGLIWPLLLVGSFLMMLLLAGAAFAWPLLFAAISVEDTDSLEALSRGYSYVFQRPLHYLFYVAVALALGVLGWLLVANFAAGVVGLTYWGTSLGAGGGQFTLVDDSLRYVYPNGDLPGHVFGRLGSSLIRLWAQSVKVLAVGFLYSFFWTASTAMYFLLRYHVDAMEMDEVALESSGDSATGLPTITTDPAGAPVVAGT